MPAATSKLILTYTPPAAALNSGVAVIDTNVTYEAQSVGALDIPISTPVGTIFEVPFGSIAGAQVAIIRNLTANAIGIRINGFGADVVTSPAATILSSLITLANELKSRYNSHIANTNGAFHAVADTANAVTSPNATDLTSAQTLLNEIKADYNAHIINTGGVYHAVNDTLNTITSVDASSLPTAIALANELKVDFNAHRIQSVHFGIDMFRLEAGGTWSMVQPLIPNLNPISSASVTILTAPATVSEFVQFWVFGT